MGGAEGTRKVRKVEEIFSLFLHWKNLKMIIGSREGMKE